MKMLRRIGLTVAAILAAFSIALAMSPRIRSDLRVMAWAAYSDLTKPNDPVTHAIRNRDDRAWGSFVTMIPRPFIKGEAKADVERQLLGAKYRADPDGIVSLTNSRQFPADSHYYELRTNEFPCEVNYVVVVQYDVQERLTDANGTSSEAGCL